MQTKSAEIPSQLLTKLRAEAKSFVNARATQECQKNRLFQTIANLTGIDINVSGDEMHLALEKVWRRLSAGLRQERKKQSCRITAL